MVGDGVDVRGDFVSLLSLVQFNDFLRVDRQSFVGIYDDAEKTRIRLRNGIQNEGHNNIISIKQMATIIENAFRMLVVTYVQGSEHP